MYNGILATREKWFKTGSLPTYYVYESLSGGLSWRAEDPSFVLPKNYTLIQGFMIKVISNTVSQSCLRFFKACLLVCRKILDKAERTD